MGDRLEALERLARLHQSGALTDEEFAAEKRRILDLPSGAAAAPGEAPAAPAEAVTVPGVVAGPSVADRMAAAGQWLRRHRLPAAALAAALVIGGYFAYATALDLRQAVPERSAKNGRGKAAGAAPDPGGQPAASASASAAGIDLASWLRFDDPKACAPGAELRALIDDMAGRQPPAGGGAATIRVPGADEARPLRVERIAVEGAREAPVATQIETPGAWRGLAVRGLRTVTWPGGVRSFQLRFGNPPSEVRRALGDAGFELAPGGELRSAGSGERAVSLGVEEIAGGAALTCVSG